jgi:xanthine dehydrogenase molybdopterin-binding subunit B
MTRVNVLHGAVIWAPYARCRVDKIDTKVEEGMPGVVRIATAADLPGGVALRPGPAPC